MAVTWSPISALERILDRPQPIGAPLLAQIDRELASLIATQPYPSEFLTGTPAYIALYDHLPEILGPKWSPPGKTIGERSEPIMQDVADGRRWIVRQHRALVAADRACGPTDTDYSCFQRLTELGAEAMNSLIAQRHNPFMWLRLGRDLPMEMAFAWNKEGSAGCVHEHGQTRFYLGALRLLAKYRALAEETTSCPSLAAFDSPEFADARIDPYSGKPLRVEKIGAGKFLVSSPEKLELGPYPNDAITIRVKCPFISEKKTTADGGV